MATATLRPRKKVWTDEELEALPKDGFKYELLDGELIMSPVHANHGMICIRLSSLLFNFVQRQKLGEVYDSSTGFRLSERVLLSPDIAFVSKARLKKILIAPDKFLYGAPDLAVEVWSPDNTEREMSEKAAHYLAHGARLVWLLRPQDRTVRVHRPGKRVETVRAGMARGDYYEVVLRQTFRASYTGKASDLFRRMQEHSRKGAEECKRLLAQRLNEDAGR